jgi:acetyl esterase
MPLDPAVENLLSLVNTPDAVALHDMSPADARAQFELLSTMIGYAGAPEPTVEARTIEGVPCQIITPPGDGHFPILVYIHGGGWVIGTADQYVPLCRDLAMKARAVVVNVDYRLAPEDPHPAAPDDCRAVAQWVVDHAAELSGKPDRIAVGGDSAGGNLSAVVALEVAGLVAQVLIYPVTDATMSRASYDENAEGYFLTKADMAWFVTNYLGADGRADNPRISPLFADDDALASTPPAIVITAEYDPLRDEGEDYAARLVDAGVPVTHTRYDGMIHGFVALNAIIPRGADAVDEIVAFLDKAFT